MAQLPKFEKLDTLVAVETTDDYGGGDDDRLQAKYDEAAPAAIPGDAMDVDAEDVSNAATPPVTSGSGKRKADGTFMASTSKVRAGESEGSPVRKTAERTVVDEDGALLRQGTNDGVTIKALTDGNVIAAERIETLKQYWTVYQSKADFRLFWAFTDAKAQKQCVNCKAWFKKPACSGPWDSGKYACTGCVNNTRPCLRLMWEDGNRVVVVLPQNERTGSAAFEYWSKP